MDATEQTCKPDTIGSTQATMGESPVTDHEWDDWAAYHLTLFRWTGAEDVSMVNLWRPAFESRGYSGEELRAASFKLAMSAAKTWRAEHLEHLLRSISAKRVALAEARRDAENAQMQRPDCGLCKGMGLVSVPHPRSLKAGPMSRPFYFAVVTCRCTLANRWLNGHRSYEDRAKAANGRIPPPLMTLEEYEFRFPFWPETLTEYQANRQTEAAAIEQTRSHDRQRGALKQAIRNVVQRATE